MEESQENQELQFIPALLGDWTLEPPERGSLLLWKDTEGGVFVLHTPERGANHPLERLMGAMLLIMQAMYRGAAEVLENGDELSPELQNMMGILHTIYNEAIEANTKEQEEETKEEENDG